MEYPIPKKWKKIFRVNNTWNNCDDLVLEGKIVCECGCSAFTVKHFAYENDEGSLEVLNDEKGFVMVVKAVCGDCGKEWELFDLSKHGYDGIICGKSAYTVNDVQLKAISLSCCGERMFEIEPKIETYLPFPK